MVLIENVRTVRSVGDVLMTSEIMVRLNTNIDSYVFHFWFDCSIIPQKRQTISLETPKILRVLLQPQKVCQVHKKPLVYPYICYCHANNHALQLDFLLKKPA